MPGYGYSYVPDTAYVAFGHDLSEGAWKGVSIAKHDNPERKITAALLAGPHPVQWKLRLTWVLAGLREAMGATSVDQLDAEWDSVQRRCNHLLGAAAEDNDPEVRAAADRLRGVLLEGGGTKQTGFEYDAEVDFGRQQVLRTSQGQAAADVKKVGLGGTMADIGRTTEALATGIGRKGGGGRRGTPYMRQRAAMAACTAAFNVVHDQLGWFVEHSSGEVREEMVALMAPFEALLARNPAPEARGYRGKGAASAAGGATTAAAAGDGSGNALSPLGVRQAGKQQ